MNLTTKLSRPWAITPAGFSDARSSLRSFLDIGMLVRERKPFNIDDGGVAHVHVAGALGDDMPPIWGMVGNTDYRTLIDEVNAATAAGAERLVLHVDSPGGMCAGLPEAARAIQQAATAMSVVADVRGMACSAAYYLSCFADTIQASASSDVGNIGCVLAWADATDFWADQGVSFNVITNAGADLKGMFHDAGRPSEVQVGFLQEQVDRLGAEFRAVVDGNRDVSEEVFRGGWYSGEQAISLGLIDAIV